MLKLLGIDAGKDPTKGVIGGDAVGELKKGLEPVVFGLAKEFKLFPTFGAADGGADGDG